MLFSKKVVLVTLGLGPTVMSGGVLASKFPFRLFRGKTPEPEIEIKTLNGTTPAEETVCDEYKEEGEVYGLCIAYCEAKNCHQTETDDPSCAKLKENYVSLTNMEFLPCESAPPTFPCAIPGVLPFPPMPELFWDFGFGIADCANELPPECCAPPTCFQTGFQITSWQLNDVFLTLTDEITEDQQMKDYVVCPGTTIAPLAFIESNKEPILVGDGDSLVNVLIKGLNLTCPTRDCTFVGGTYHILATDFIFGTPDVSGLNIEGFTFTGVMEPVEVGDGGGELGYGRDGLYAASIVIDGPVGNDITIKDCTFKDITFPVVDGENCFEQGYTGIYVDSPDSRIIEVSIDNVNFENIRGGLPIYAFDQACFEDTGELRPVNRLIDNRGQLVSVTNSVIKNNEALYFYLLGVSSDATEGLTYGNIENNVFQKNTVKNLIVKELGDPLINGFVNMTGNKIKGNQTYTGGAYCPVYTYDSSIPFPTDGIDNTCEATEICFDQSRAYSLNQANCAEFSDGGLV